MTVVLRATGPFAPATAEGLEPQDTCAGEGLTTTPRAARASPARFLPRAGLLERATMAMDQALVTALCR